MKFLESLSDCSSWSLLLSYLLLKVYCAWNSSRIYLKFVLSIEDSRTRSLKRFLITIIIKHSLSKNLILIRYETESISPCLNERKSQDSQQSCFTSEYSLLWAPYTSFKFGPIIWPRAINTMCRDFTGNIYWELTIWGGGSAKLEKSKNNKQTYWTIKTDKKLYQLGFTCESIENESRRISPTPNTYAVATTISRDSFQLLGPD